MTATSAATSEANTTLIPAEVGILAPRGRVKLWTSGVPVRCPGGTWTEEEGAKTVDECGELTAVLYATHDGPAAMLAMVLAYSLS